MPPRRKPAPPPSAAEVNMMRRFLQPETAPLPRTPSGLLPASAFILAADTNRPEAQAARIQTAFTDLPVKEVPAKVEPGKVGPNRAPALTTKYRPGLAARAEHMRLALTPNYRERDVYHRNPDVDERTSLYMRIKILSLFPSIYAN
jgi:hypothetical protein